MTLSLDAEIHRGGRRQRPPQAAQRPARKQTDQREKKRLSHESLGFRGRLNLACAFFLEASSSKQREQDMIAPFAVDQQISFRQPLLAEARLGQKTARRLHFRAGRPLRCGAAPACRTRKGSSALTASGHVALAREGRADPITQRAALRDPAPHIGKRAAAHQRVVALAEDEKHISRIQPRLLLIALDAAAEGAAGQFIVGPDRLPFGEEFAALAAQPGPVGVIADARIAQIDVPARGSPAAGRRER